MNDNPIIVRACVFDAYGTLFDFASAAAACSEELGERAGELTRLWRDKQLQYTWLRGLQGKHTDFWTVTGEALDFSLETLGFQGRVLRERLMALYRHLACFEEVPDVLSDLRAAGFKTAILSNGSMPMLESAVNAAGLADLLDFIWSVDEVGVFKPHPSVYQLAVEGLALEPDKISFQSSNAWDAHAASAFGMRVVWCNRYSQRQERLPGEPDREITNLRELQPLLTLG
ncbi:MAG: haloacid dehalogenase type II [Burkholderiaceae bacterium]